MYILLHNKIMMIDLKGYRVISSKTFDNYLWNNSSAISMILIYSEEIIYVEIQSFAERI